MGTVYYIQTCPMVSGGKLEDFRLPNREALRHALSLMHTDIKSHLLLETPIILTTSDLVVQLMVDLGNVWYFLTKQVSYVGSLTMYSRYVEVS